MIGNEFERLRLLSVLNKDISPEVPSYVMAVDKDFQGTTNDNFRYIRSGEYIKIPHIIKGVTVRSYREMFQHSSASIKGVYSDNPRVTTMTSMFRNSKATTLDLSSLDTSNVTNMVQMFYNCKATTLDLSSFNTSKVTNMNSMFQESKATTLDLSSFDMSKVDNTGSMFRNCSATTGYARTQSDANKLNASSNKPSRLKFIVKP